RGNRVRLDDAELLLTFKRHPRYRSQPMSNWPLNLSIPRWARAWARCRGEGLAGTRLRRRPFGPCRGSVLRPYGSGSESFSDGEAGIVSRLTIEQAHIKRQMFLAYSTLQGVLSRFDTTAERFRIVRKLGPRPLPSTQVLYHNHLEKLAPAICTQASPAMTGIGKSSLAPAPTDLRPSAGRSEPFSGGPRE